LLEKLHQVPKGLLKKLLGLLVSDDHPIIQPVVSPVSQEICKNYKTDIQDKTSSTTKCNNNKYYRKKHLIFAYIKWKENCGLGISKKTK